MNAVGSSDSIIFHCCILNYEDWHDLLDDVWDNIIVEMDSPAIFAANVEEDIKLNVVHRIQN